MSSSSASPFATVYPLYVRKAEDAGLSPALPRDGKAHGPVYFRYVNDNFIYPDPELTASTIDGGVLYVNVPPGRYTLTAKKEGHRFTSVSLDCRAGVLVNAAPPRGLQEE